MIDRYVIWTDGSAIGHDCRRGDRQPGGWAAVVEHGTDGYVVRGREPDTTNTRMELRAVIEGLRSVPPWHPATVWTDASAVLTCHSRWLRGVPLEGKDADLWRELAAEFERVADTGLRVLAVPGRTHVPQHKRAHSIAGAEARSQAKGLDPSVTILSPVEKNERRRGLLPRYAERNPTHLRGCSWGWCVAGCPVIEAAAATP